MKISELIEELEAIRAEHGDIPCLIEFTEWEDMEIGECSVEDRLGYGLSVKFLI